MDFIFFVGLLVCAVVAVVAFLLNEKKKIGYCVASMKQMAERASYDYHQYQRAQFVYDRLATSASWFELVKARGEHEYSQYLLRESMNRYRSTPLIMR
jgi:hypothetical protein